MKGLPRERREVCGPANDKKVEGEFGALTKVVPHIKLYIHHIQYIPSGNFKHSY